MMDKETQIALNQAKLNQVVSQRDVFANTCAELGAQLEITQKQLSDMTERCKKVEAELDEIRNADEAPEIKEAE